MQPADRVQRLHLHVVKDTYQSRGPSMQSKIACSSADLIRIAVMAPVERIDHDARPVRAAACLKEQNESVQDPPSLYKLKDV